MLTISARITSLRGQSYHAFIRDLNIVLMTFNSLHPKVLTWVIKGRVHATLSIPTVH